MDFQKLYYSFNSLFGTTSRVKNHIDRENIDFSALNTIVLDKIDVMLIFGFKKDVERILRKCREVCPQDL
jgi:ATP-independent RNA helicase DbpA